MEEHTSSQVTIDPGPSQDTLLYLQHEHRSEDIWKTGDESVLYCRHGGLPLFRDRPVLDARITDRLRVAGFYGAYRLGYMELDHSLITAMVERWRVETHSFHLPTGEATITLQDMGVLTGLNVDGGAITGSSLTKGDCVDLCTRLLGSSPPDGKPNWSGLGISNKWLLDLITVLPEEATHEEVDRQARAVIMYMLGTYLMVDRKGTHVPVMLLQLLDSLEECGKLAWGAGILANLYREMCRSVPPDVTQIGGFLEVLQLWAWEHITCIRPTLVDGGQLRGEYSISEDPRGRYWACRSVNVVQHSLRHYRDQLDRLQESQMVWDPYPTDVLQLLPPECVAGMSVWLARVPLICFVIVEWHFADRVMRQFGLQQCVPTRCDTNTTLHNVDRRGRKANEDWASRHAVHIGHWNSRRESLVQGTPSVDPMNATDDYMQWYKKHTRLLIHPPTPPASSIGFSTTGAQQTVLVQALQMVLRLADEHEKVDQIATHQAAWIKVREIVMSAAIQTVGLDVLQAEHGGTSQGDTSTTAHASTTPAPQVRLHRPRRKPQSHASRTGGTVAASQSLVDEAEYDATLSSPPPPLDTTTTSSTPQPPPPPPPTPPPPPVPILSRPPTPRPATTQPPPSPQPPTAPLRPPPQSTSTPPPPSKQPTTTTTDNAPIHGTSVPCFDLGVHLSQPAGNTSEITQATQESCNVLPVPSSTSDSPPVAKDTKKITKKRKPREEGVPRPPSKRVSKPPPCDT